MNAQRNKKEMFMKYYRKKENIHRPCSSFYFEEKFAKYFHQNKIFINSVIYSMIRFRFILSFFNLTLGSVFCRWCNSKQVVLNGRHRDVSFVSEAKNKTQILILSIFPGQKIFSSSILFFLFLHFEIAKCINDWFALAAVLKIFSSNSPLIVAKWKQKVLCVI